MKNLLYTALGFAAGYALFSRSSNVGVTKPQSFRKQFSNQFGSFTSVFVYVPAKRDNEFLVQTQVRKKNEDGSVSIQTKDKWFPIERYADFAEDLNRRTAISGPGALAVITTLTPWPIL